MLKTRQNQNNSDQYLSKLLQMNKAIAIKIWSVQEENKESETGYTFI